MAKEITDLSTLTDAQLLAEFADRVLAYEKSADRLAEWEADRKVGGVLTLDDEMSDERSDLVLDHDDDYCRLREIVRFVKRDDTIWAD